MFSNLSESSSFAAISIIIIENATLHPKLAGTAQVIPSIYAFIATIGVMKGDKAISTPIPTGPKEESDKNIRRKPGIITKNDSWPVNVEDALTLGANEPNSSPSDATASNERNVPTTIISKAFVPSNASAAELNACGAAPTALPDVLELALLTEVVTAPKTIDVYISIPTVNDAVASAATTRVPASFDNTILTLGIGSERRTSRVFSSFSVAMDVEAKPSAVTMTINGAITNVNETINRDASA